MEKYRATFLLQEYGREFGCRSQGRAKDRSEALALRELPLAGQLSSTLSAEQRHQANRYEDHDVEDVGKVQRVHEQYALADGRQGQAPSDILPL